MEHKGTKIIETERLILRPLTVADAEAGYRNWCSDPKVTEYLTWPPHGSVEVTEKIFKMWEDSYSEPQFYQWGIVLKELGEPIGSISVVEMDERTDTLQVGYCIGSNWWHRGIMSEAFSAVIDFLFEEVGANRIEAKHDSKNPHSGGVMSKCGLLYEGTMRRSVRSNMGIGDAEMRAILHSDWENRKQIQRV